MVAAQPVPPLLAYAMIESPAGWALALCAIALVDLLLLTTVISEGRLLPRWPTTSSAGHATANQWCKSSV